MSHGPRPPTPSGLVPLPSVMSSWCFARPPCGIRTTASGQGDGPSAPAPPPEDAEEVKLERGLSPPSEDELRLRLVTTTWRIRPSRRDARSGRHRVRLNVKAIFPMASNGLSRCLACYSGDTSATRSRAHHHGRRRQRGPIPTGHRFRRPACGASPHQRVRGHRSPLSTVALRPVVRCLDTALKTLFRWSDR